MSTSPLGMDNFLRLLRRYLSLQIENARLTVTQRLTLLLTGAAFAAVIFFLAMWCMFFAAISGANFLGEVMSMGWAYLIIVTIYLILILICLMFKRRLFLNPIARFLSSLILEAPKHEEVIVTEETTAVTPLEDEKAH